MTRAAVATIVGIAFLSVVSPQSSCGAITVFTDNDATSDGAKYQTSQAANISVTYNATDVGSQQGTVTISTTWGAGDFAPRSIVFTQTALPDATADVFGATAGARFQVVLSLGNNTGQSWLNFQVNLTDNSVPAGITIGSTGSHLGEAHFHNNTGGPTLSGTNFTTTDFVTNSQSFLVYGGLHDSGNLGIQSFFLHERNLKNAQGQSVAREFTMTLAPNVFPEPTSLAIWGLGALGCGIAGYRRRKLA